MFSGLLPRPKHSAYSKVVSLEKPPPASRSLVAIPAESSVSIAQKPTQNNTISKYYLSSDGTLNYSLTIASANSDRRFHASYEDTVPLKVRFPRLKHSFPKYSLENSPDDSIRHCVEETRAVVNRLLQQKLGAVEKKDDTDFVTYTSNNIAEERGRETVIQVKDYQQDPMLPPKHKLRKNRHQNPSPPPPVLKRTKEAKLTKEDQEKWRIPSAISNWKNNQGFTISLDKRMVNSAGAQTPVVNLEKLGGLSSALEGADKQAREEIRLRNEMRKQMHIKQEKEKEAKLKELAELARTNQFKRTQHSDHDSDKKRRY